jgi:hypothetical protein
VIGNESIRCGLTVLFAAVGAVYLVAGARALRRRGPRRGRPAVGAGLHVLMCAAMISMCWSWGTAIPVIALVTVFTGAAGWFAGQALFIQHGAGSFLSENWSHAGMMTVMVWMAVMMPLSAASPATGASAGGNAMAGMDMGAPAAAGSPAAVLAAAGSPGWAATTCVVLAVALAVVTVAALAAPGGRNDTAPARSGAGVATRDGTLAVMAAGMAAALLAMA